MLQCDLNYFNNSFNSSYSKKYDEEINLSLKDSFGDMNKKSEKCDYAHFKL